MSQPLTILFATSTGNAEECATRAATEAATFGFSPKLENVGNYNVKDLTKLATVLLFVSTWGEGEPPDDGIPFWEELQKMEENSLAGVRFGVFALGDTSYEYYCGFGVKCDAQFEKLGATRILDCRQCDLDYDDHIEGWFRDVFAALSSAPEIFAV